MAGYLDRLAARALGTARVAEPVAPSLFAPRQAAHFAGWSSAALREVQEEREAGPAGRSDARPSQAVVKDATRLNPTLAMAEPASRQRRSRQPHDDQRQEHDGSAQPKPPLRPIERQTSIAALRATRLPEDTRAAEPLFRPVPPPSRREAPPQPDPGWRSAIASDGMTPQAHRAEPKDAPGARASERGPAREPQAPMARSAQQTQPPAAPPAPGAPEVRITIGRVEIRAMQAPPAKPAVAPAPQRPALSIEKYRAEREARR